MPPYQRSYSWEENEVRDLLSDLTDAAKTLRFHFIGAIVLVRLEDNSYLVVDGQQRLSTITMILAVLRDLEEDERRRANIHALIGDPERAMLGEPAAWRLTLNHIDNPFFRQAVQSEGSTLRQDIEAGDVPTHSRMWANVKMLHKTLVNMSPAERVSLYETIRDRVILVRVTVPDWNGGYDVFRVLNTRGKAPNSHDIVKTEILQKANVSAEEANAYARQWLEHEATLGGSGLDDLLAVICQLHSKGSKGKAANEFGKRVLSRVEPRRFLDRDLPRYVEAYRTVLKGEPDFGALNSAIKTPIDHLRLLDHALWKAPAVAYLYMHPDNGEKAAQFFEYLERFGFCLMLHFTTQDARRRRFARLTQAILNGKPLYDRGGVLDFSRDERRKIRERLVGRFGNFAQRRAITLRLNAALENGHPIRPEDDATVEHVLPRSPPDQSFWHTTWPKLQVQRELCETIGNFVIVPEHINRIADRLDFREKKKIFFDSEAGVFALTEDLRGRNTWTAEDVRARTEQLADIMMYAWFGD